VITSDLVNWEIDYSPTKQVSLEAYNLFKKKQDIQENDILFVIAGATIGKVAILPKELTPSNTNQAVSFIRLKEGENHKFVHYWLLSSKIYDQIWFWAVQSAQPNLSMESLGNFPVPYPSIHEQELIVNFLNCKFGEYESVIVNNLNQIEKLKEYRQSLISEAVTGKIDVRDWS
jgi:type I restriction enzyme S subunit